MHVVKYSFNVSVSRFLTSIFTTYRYTHGNEITYTICERLILKARLTRNKQLRPVECVQQCMLTDYSIDWKHWNHIPSLVGRESWKERDRQKERGGERKREG